MKEHKNVNDLSTKKYKCLEIKPNWKSLKKGFPFFNFYDSI